jgi:hypothetical protein
MSGNDVTDRASGRAAETRRSARVAEYADGPAGAESSVTLETTSQGGGDAFEQDRADDDGMARAAPRYRLDAILGVGPTVHPT